MDASLPGLARGVERTLAASVERTRAGSSSTRVPSRCIVRAMRLVVTCALGLALASCGGRPPPVCGSNAACKNGDVCVVGTCTNGGSPVPTLTRRVVLDPDGVAYVSAANGVEVRAPSIALGASVGGGARILLKFPRGDWSADRVAKAYLVLERAEGVEAGPDDVVLRAQKITEPWSPKLAGKGTSWASPPSARSLPGGEAHVSANGHTPIRIDVTSFAVDLVKPTVRAFGLRIEADGGGFGVPIATGLGAGRAPRLEVYLNP